MKGRDLWAVFLTAGIPAAELKALGEAMGYMLDQPSRAGQAALLKIGYALKQRGAASTSNKIFSALKHEMPGIFQRKSLLYAIAEDYQAKKPYVFMQPHVRNYFDAVGPHLPAITKAAPKPDIALKTSAPPSIKPTAPIVTATHTVEVDKPPPGLHRNQWEYIKIVTRQLAHPKTRDKVASGNIAAARNLAERGGMTATVQALDAEIERRGAGAQFPSKTAPAPSSSLRVPLLFLLGAGAFFFLTRT